jgi:hypothetical protein
MDLGGGLALLSARDSWLRGLARRVGAGGGTNARPLRERFMSVPWPPWLPAFPVVTLSGARGERGVSLGGDESGPRPWRKGRSATVDGSPAGITCGRRRIP